MATVDETYSSNESKTGSVGILTVNRLLNFGSQLQAYALSRAIEALGYSPVVIDYEPSGPKPLSTPARLARILLQPGNAASGIRRRIIDRKIERVTRESVQAVRAFSESAYTLSRARYRSLADLSENPPGCDAFVAGSDQIWNPLGTNYGDATYYLGFAAPEKRVAYAPSFGVAEIPKERQKWVKEMLLGIKHLSAREEEGAAIIEELVGVNVPVVLDPTLLLNADEWVRVLPVPSMTKPYVLQYVLENDPYIRERAQSIAKRLGCSLVIIPISRYDIVDNPKPDCWAADIGPLQFMSLIKNAEFVCTDSFHGMILSMLHHRPFIVFDRYRNKVEAASSSRMRSMLRISGFSERFAGQHDDLSQLFEIDYSGFNARLEVRRSMSLSYLARALSDVVSTRTD